MTARTDVAIVGATGVTGGIAFDEAERLGLAPIALGRNAAKLQAFLTQRGLAADRFRVVDIHDPASLDRAFSDVRIVISTVAPFRENGIEIASAAARAGIAYTDPSGESGFLQSILKLDATANQSGATLCPGNGIAAFLGDIAIHSIVVPSRDRSGGVLYDIQGYRPTGGSIKSYLTSILPVGSPRIRNGQVELRPFADYAGTVAGIAGFNTVVPDALVVSRYWQPTQFDSLGKAGKEPRIVARILSGALTDTFLSRLLMKLPFDNWLVFDPNKDAKSSVTVHAEVIAQDGTSHRRVIMGRAIYQLTGRILAATAKAMFDHDHLPRGVRAASEVFSSFENALALTGAQEITNDGQT